MSQNDIVINTEYLFKVGNSKPCFKEIESVTLESF